MILTFRELGIRPTEYAGLNEADRDAHIINEACDYIMLKFFPNMDEHEAIPYPERAKVDVPSHTVRVYTVSYQVH